MTMGEERAFTGGMLAKSIFNFVCNYFLLLAIALFMVFLKQGGDYADYLAKNLPVLFFTAGCLFLLLWIIYLYYFFEKKFFLAEMKNIWLIFLILDVCILLAFFMGNYVDVYARPVALLALLALFLIGYRDAIFLNIVFAVTMFILDVFVEYDVYVATGVTNGMFPSFMLTFIAGTFAVFIGKSAKTRNQILGTGAIIALPTLAIIFLLKISDYANFADMDTLLSLLFGFGGSLFSAVFLLAFLPIFENMFSVLTVFRLRELTAPESKLLKRLISEARGTFNHSMTVAQLAESCASALGENVELARAAAYYHDVGKLRQPDFFTENQTDHNLHDELTPELSADIIRSHTKDGYHLITAYHLPKFFAEVATEHHGTLPIKYFYAKALRMSDGEINVENYSYQGPKPKSKIAAIIMIADACEAATRSLTDRSVENVERAVHAIIQERMDLNQFSECQITMNDLTVIKQTLISALTGLYHHRIKYPDLRFSRSGVEDKGGKVND
ncbi:MAG: HD domain-containing protein [Clostridia bacterium]|nr:HD domain-containing protein [Clostridia bacterium]